VFAIARFAAFILGPGAPALGFATIPVGGVLPVGAFGIRVAPRFFRQSRLKFLDAIAITLFDAGAVVAAAATGRDKRGLVVVERIPLLFRELPHDAIIGRCQFLIELAEPLVLADRPLVGVAGIPAIEALGICSVGSKPGDYQKRAQCASKEMGRQGGTVWRSRHRGRSAAAVRARLSPQQTPEGPGSDASSIN
jgi:hypothetical protein